MEKIVKKVKTEKNDHEIKLNIASPFDSTSIGQFFTSIYTKYTIPEGSSLGNIILEYVIQNKNAPQFLQQMFKNCSKVKPVCAKIMKYEMGIKCLDCEKDPTCIICKQCYENGNHKGHRIIMQKSTLGCCDCGDPEAFKEQGFCKDHPGYAKFNPIQSLNNIPEEFQKRFMDGFGKALHYLFLLIDMLGLSIQTNKLFDSVLISMISGISDVVEYNASVNLLLCKLLSSKMNEDIKLYHKCENLI